MAVTSGLSLAEKLELLALLEEKARRLAENRLASYKPYPRQEEFHAAGATFRERLFRAGNQCLSPWSWVEMEHSTALSAIAFASTGARVRSWSGESECAVPLQNGFLRGIEPTFRLVLADGRFFDCPPNHQILHESGWLSADQIMSLSGGVRFWETREGYQASCVEHGYLCDPQLPLDLDSDPSRLLQLADAQERTLSFSLEDAEARTRRCTNTYRASDRLSMRSDGLNRLADLCAKFAGPAVSKSVLPLRDAHRDRLRLVAGLGAQLRSSGELPRHGEVLLDPFQTAGLSPSASCTLGPSPSIGQGDQQSLDAVGPGHSTQALDHDDRRLAIFVTFEPIRLVGGSEIVAIMPIGFQPVLDVQVPNTHNYKAAGVYHHNCGKTWSSSYEVAMHVTGRYPDWWPGRKWSRPVVGWAIGESMESTRDTMQRLILGRPGEWGTGTIPKACIQGIKRAQGISDAVDCILIKHESGGISHLYFKSYEKGRSKLQGETLDFAALDEEPPLDIYTEVLTRTNATKGMVWITFTPLLGMSKVVCQFLQNPTPDRSDTNMTIDDVLHYSDEERARIIAGYPEHEREARAKGIPILGSGRIFPVAESLITVPDFPLPDLWPRIAGMDFGWDHPSAAAWLAWDRDEHILYVYSAMREREQTAAEFAPGILARGAWIPMAWPADGLQHEKGSGSQLAEQYRLAGVNMLHEHAQLPETGDGADTRISRVSVEAGLQIMLQAFKANDPDEYARQQDLLTKAGRGHEKPLRIHVFASLNDWFEEFRLYHRKDGKVVKLQDDLMAATRYAYAMLRYATTPPDPSRLQITRSGSSDWRAL